MSEMPGTLEGILEDIHRRNTPKYDKYGGEDTGVFLYNCGWVAYCGETATCNLFNDTFKTAIDAASALWKWYDERIWR